MGAFDDLLPAGDDPFADLGTQRQPGDLLKGGFMASAKQSAGSLVKGAGQFAADFLPGVSDDNAVKRYGQEVIDANPVAVLSLEDIADKPLTAAKEAVGNAASSMAGIVGARLLGQGITAAAPLTGPAAPIVAGVGQGISLLGPYAVAALPSFGSIREKQGTDTTEDKAIAALGAGTVGLIENKFGPQEWALSAMTKTGRAQLAEKFAAKTLPGAIGKGMATGAAIEGAEELVQNPIEQLASYQDPTTQERIDETLFGGAMGAIGGGLVGGPIAGIARRPDVAIVPRADGQGEIEIRPEDGPISAAAVSYVQQQQGLIDEATAAPMDDLFADLTPTSQPEVEPATLATDALGDWLAQVEPVSLEEAQALANQAPEVQAVVRHGEGYAIAPREWLAPEQLDQALQPGALSGRIQALQPEQLGQSLAPQAPTEPLRTMKGVKPNEAGVYWAGVERIGGKKGPVINVVQLEDGSWVAGAGFDYVGGENLAGVAHKDGPRAKTREEAISRAVEYAKERLERTVARYEGMTDYKDAPKYIDKGRRYLAWFDEQIGRGTVDHAASQANPTPSEAQKAAGNYQKGHIKVGPLDIAVENPVGSTRTGTGWQTTMAAHYGYLKRTEGADGDQVDVYVKAGTPADHAGPVYVIDQFDPATGRFDEHKSFIGYSNQAEAVAAYDQHFSDGSGPKRRRGVVEMSTEQFKQWARDGDTKKPAAQPATIEDFGEKIGGARKDLAQPTGTKAKAAVAPVDVEPGWRKRFSPMQNMLRADETWHLFDTKTGKAIRGAEFKSEQAAKDAIPLIAVAQKHRVTSVKDGFEIMRDVTDRKRVTVVDRIFPTREEAMAYMAAHAQEIIETKTSFREELFARPEKVMREGAQRRTGPATAEDFTKTFGFRGVEFGLWNNQDERQEVMNHAFDGLLDLADVLGVPPKALSLNGDLALAFGARGQGLSGAVAHYERNYGVINLTKMQGAGSLAHEWMHAADHYFGRQDGKAKSEKVQNKRGDMVFDTDGPSDYASHGLRYAKSGMREEVRAKYKELIDTLFRKAEKYVEDTAQAEKFVGATRDALVKSLTAMRKQLEKAPDWQKRNNKPATAEQLAEFDRLAADLVEGKAFELETRSSAPTKGRRFGAIRLSNDQLDGLSDLYKKVRGRSGMNAERTGVVDGIRGDLRRYADRMRMLDDARNANEKTKSVPTRFAMDAKRIDQGSATDYWTTPHEMAARAFSAYVEDKVAGRSDFLSFGSDNNRPEYRLFNVRPFPEGDERQAINQAFDALFATLQTRETEKGVELFAEPANHAAPTDTDRLIFTVARAGITANALLDIIAQRSASPLNRELAKMLKAQELQTSLSVTPDDGRGAGSFNPVTDAVEIHGEARAEQVVLHELVHAATVKALTSKSLASGAMRSLLKEVRKELGIDSHYGLGTVFEFVAEAFTNPDFQQALKGIKVKPAGKLVQAWQSFVSTLRQLLGLDRANETALGKAIELGAQLMHENRTARFAHPLTGKLYAQATDESNWLNHQLTNHRSWALGALTRDQLADIYGKDMPEVADFDRVVQQMDQARNIVAEQADAIVERWRKLPAKVADSLADIMHTATLEQFDPDTKTDVQTPEQSIVKKDWAALPEDAKQLYRDVRDQYQATLVKLRNGLAKRADTQTAAAIRLEFDKYLAQGPYFPLARFGDVILIADKNEQRIVEAFESSAAREKRARGLRAQGWKTKLTAKKAYSAASDGPSGEFVGKVLGMVGGLDIEAKEKASLMDSLNQLAISALPDQSYRRHFSHRKGTPGFSQDAMRAFASSMQHVAHHVARVLHGDELQILVDGLNKRVRETTGDVDTTAMQQVANELAKRMDLMLNPTTHPVTAALGQVGFVMSLGGSIAAGVTNLTQTPLVTYPWLGARFGFDKAAGALTKASKDYFGGRWDKWSGFVMKDSQTLTADERRAMAELEDAGLINLSQAHDLAGVANTDKASSSRAFAINRAMKIVGWTFHVPEVMNRQVSALAAYRLAIEKGLDHQAAIETARETLRRTHFDYSASNRARWMAGNFTRVITMFKQYSQNMTYLLWRQTHQALKAESPEVRREARRMLLGIATMHFAAAGALGLPLGVFGISPLLGLLAMGMGDDDEPWDWQTEFRNMLADTFGQEAGEAIARGPLRTLTGVDFASRVGLGDLWIRAPQAEKEGRDLVEAWMLTLLGPVAGYAGNMGTAVKAFEEGKFGRGFEAMLPKFIASPIKALRYDSDGVQSWRGDDLGVQLDGGDIFATAIGFQPAQLAEMFEGRAAVKGREAKLAGRREEISNMFVSAVLAGDQDMQAEAIKAAQAFSLRNPSMVLSADSLRRSLQAKVRNQAQIRDGVFMAKKREELREVGRFANVE